MIIRDPGAARREVVRERIDADLVVVGGGMAGTCCAITAARLGLRVTLVQDRPVLGGNASSEVRLWVLGATSHLGNNNRWAREGGVINEILVENQFRNPEGNAVIFDTVVLDVATAEPNLRLLLNTAAIAVQQDPPGTITGVEAYCSQNETLYELRAPLFCDASGDGVIAFLAGAAFRMGAEAADEFGEKFAPDASYGELLGHSIYFYSKDTGRPVTFVPPRYALTDITRIPRYKSFNAQSSGCRLWWLEWGGRGDTIHETESIKWELWKVAYGVWNHIKNSGQFPDAANLTLEWVGLIPGKRESRRFEGDYLLSQRDLVEQRHFADAVSFGGWSIDLHPADGVYSERPGCDQWHARGVYQIPYRCLYSRNVSNLFLAGRIISASHVAFGSTRVMATCANSAQAVAVAAVHCRRDGLLPRDLLASARMQRLQRDLTRTGQHLPRHCPADPEDLARQATVTASSELQVFWLPADGPLAPLNVARAQLIPVAAGPLPELTLTLDVAAPTALEIELRTSDHPTNHTPDVVLARQTIQLQPGQGLKVPVGFEVSIDQPRYVFLTLRPNPQVQVRCSQQRVTGVLSVARRHEQAPSRDIGVERFEFWTPTRRPGGHNLAIETAATTAAFAAANVINGVARPTSGPNAWVAGYHDEAPRLVLTWPTPQRIRRVLLTFDTDWDHPMESVLMGQPEAAMPFCIKAWRLTDAAGRVLAERQDNHQTRNEVSLPEPVTTTQLHLEVLERWSAAPAAVFEVRCYA